jgi:ribonuclease HI
MIHIYCDGACHRNGQETALGSYSFVIVEDGKIIHEYSRAESKYNDAPITNNIMELMGAITALEYLKDATGPEDVIKIFSDSKYVVNGITTWIHGWLMRDWKNAYGEAVKNQTLWEKLYGLSQHSLVYFEWVRGHDGNIFNERADMLCNEALDKAYGRKPKPQSPYYTDLKRKRRFKRKS